MSGTLLRPMQLSIQVNYSGFNRLTAVVLSRVVVLLIGHGCRPEVSVPGRLREVLCFH